jgi:hypothetical protein
MSENSMKNVRFDIGGTFNPKGCVTVFFESEAEARSVAAEIIAGGVADADCSVFDPKNIAEWAGQNVDEAGFFASLGYGIKVVQQHKELADAGKWSMVVRAPSEAETEKVMVSIRKVKFMCAHKFNALTIEDLT